MQNSLAVIPVEFGFDDRARIADLEDTVRDLALGASMMLQPGIALGALADYARDIARVTDLALTSKAPTTQVRILQLETALRELVQRAVAKQQPGVCTGAFLHFAQEIERVALDPLTRITAYA
jgi:hypothetical protein